jgi:hypothetical protein
VKSTQIRSFVIGIAVFVSLLTLLIRIAIPSHSFYGKIIDQYGEPVEGAMVTGKRIPEPALLGEIRIGPERVYTTQSDKNGEFRLKYYESKVGAKVEKEGYEMGFGNGTYQTPNKEGKTTPNERAIFTMWKLKGAEPMVHKEIRTGLSCDGAPTTLDLLTGHRVANGGDLVITMTRTPLDIDRRQPFDWTVTFAIIGGGLREIHDPYPNEAPAEGYQPSITLNIHAGPPYFTGNKFDQSYYFKSRNGQVYGHMKLHVTADYQPPPTPIEIEVFANPASSRNLEFDPWNQINP